MNRQFERGELATPAYNLSRQLEQTGSLVN